MPEMKKNLDISKSIEKKGIQKQGIKRGRPSYIEKVKKNIESIMSKNEELIKRINNRLTELESKYNKYELMKKYFSEYRTFYYNKHYLDDESYNEMIENKRNQINRLKDKILEAQKKMEEMDRQYNIRQMRAIKEKIDLYKSLNEDILKAKGEAFDTLVQQRNMIRKILEKVYDKYNKPENELWKYDDDFIKQIESYINEKLSEYDSLKSRINGWKETIERIEKQIDEMPKERKEIEELKKKLTKFFTDIDFDKEIPSPYDIEKEIDKNLPSLSKSIKTSKSNINELKRRNENMKILYSNKQFIKFLSKVEKAGWSRFLLNLTSKGEIYRREDLGRIGIKIKMPLISAPILELIKLREDNENIMIKNVDEADVVLWFDEKRRKK